jgi:hypothetical protein
MRHPLRWQLQLQYTWTASRQPQLARGLSWLRVMKEYGEQQRHDGEHDGVADDPDAAHLQAPHDDPLNPARASTPLTIISTRISAARRPPLKDGRGEQDRQCEDLVPRQNVEGIDD